VIAGASHVLIQENADTSLLLHAPASLTFTLRGDERRLRFEYGFRHGAYSGGGQTDGATFTVELLRPREDPKILFQRELDPIGKATDQGTDVADFSLPSANAGSKLLIRVDPGKGNAWDWTFITNFLLE